MDKYKVYMHINKLNNKTYIGMTKQSVKRRWKNGKAYIGKFREDIDKYGWYNFEHIVLIKNKTKKEAEKLERLFITILMSNISEFGYNIENGGNYKGKTAESTKLKLREINTGKTHSKEAKLKISQTLKHRKISDEAKLKLSNYMKGRVSELHPSSKKVFCGGMIFNTLKECAEYYNVHKSTMGSWLLGKVEMPQNFAELNLHYLNKDNKIKISETNKKHKKKNIRVICDDKIFNTITNCSKYYGICKSSMARWLKGKTKMPQKFIDLGLRYFEENNVQE